MVSKDGQLRVLGPTVQWRALHNYPWIDLVSVKTLLELASEADLTDFQIGTVTTGATGTLADARLTEIEPNLYSLDLTLPRGLPGPAVELRRGDTHIQWRLIDETTWYDLVALADIKGATGDVGPSGKSAYQSWLDAGNTGTAVDFLATLKGPKGDPGLNGGAAFNRATVVLTTVELAPGATHNDEVLLGASYRLMRLTTDAPARVRVYTTLAQRVADAGRSLGTQPTGDHGVQLDVATTPELLSMTLTPTVDGFDGEAQPDGYIPFAVTNTGNATTVINVTLTYLRTE